MVPESKDTKNDKPLNRNMNRLMQNFKDGVKRRVQYDMGRSSESWQIILILVLFFAIIFFHDYLKQTFGTSWITIPLIILILLPCFRKMNRFMRKFEDGKKKQRIDEE